MPLSSTIIRNEMYEKKKWKWSEEDIDKIKWFYALGWNNKTKLDSEEPIQIFQYNNCVRSYVIEAMV